VIIKHPITAQTCCSVAVLGWRLELGCCSTSWVLYHLQFAPPVFGVAPPVLVSWILRKIIKSAATRYNILRPKCTKFDFGWGCAPDPAGGAYSAPPDLLAGFQGLLLRGREVRRGEKERGRGGRDERGGKGRETEHSTTRFLGLVPPLVLLHYLVKH